MHLNVKLSSETQLKQLLDFLYEKAKQNTAFTGLLEAAANEVTIVTAIHNIKSNKGSKTAGVDKAKMDKYLQMPKEEVVALIQNNLKHYLPKPARREYIDKGNGKKRPLGIPTILDRIIQECVRIIIEPICEAKFYPNSYGFRPYRAQKHAVRDVINIINASTKSKDQPVWVLEGDIKGCFDNINHRILLQKLWKMGIHDKRILKIIQQMLKAGYIEYDMFCKSERGVSQGGIISPLLSNVYLNDFDWYIGRKFYHPFPHCKHSRNDTRRLKWMGVKPKYNIRFADDWVILTSTEHEAKKLKKALSKYFKYRLKLELSDDKTKITDMRTNGIEFLGFVIKAEKPRKTPGDNRENLIGKPYPNMKKLSVKIKNLCKEIRAIKTYYTDNFRIAQMDYVNSIVMGISEYIKIGISSHAFRAIDRRVNNSCFATWKRMYPKAYNKMQIRLKHLSNLPHRHEGYDSRTFAIKYQNMWFGITKAFLTHIKYEQKPFNQKMTPFTVEGRRIYKNYRSNNKPLPKDRPPIHIPEDFKLCVYDKTKYSIKYNFEYFMNREYAFNRDKGVCRCCKTSLWDTDNKNCHHVADLSIEQINKVPNLAWVCIDCHKMIHNSQVPDNLNPKKIKKILNFREKYYKAKSVSTIKP